MGETDQGLLHLDYRSGNRDDNDDTSVDSPIKPSPSSSALSLPPPPRPRPSRPSLRVPLPPPSLDTANLPPVTHTAQGRLREIEIEDQLSQVVPLLPIPEKIYQAILALRCQRDTTGVYTALQRDASATKGFGSVLERMKIFADSVAIYVQLPVTQSVLNPMQVLHEDGELRRQLPCLVESVRLLHHIETVVLPQCKAGIQELSPVMASDIREAKGAEAQARKTLKRIADDPARTHALSQATATLMAAYAHLTTIQTYAARFSEQVGRVFSPSVFAWMTLMAWVQVDTLLAYRRVKASLDRFLPEPIKSLPLWAKSMLVECHNHLQGIFTLNKTGERMSYKPNDMGYQCVECHRALTPITPSPKDSPWFVSSVLTGTAPLAMWPWRQPEHNCTLCMVTKDGGAALDSWCNDALHDSFQAAMLTESKPWMTLAEPVLLDLVQRMSEKAL